MGPSRKSLLVPSKHRQVALRPSNKSYRGRQNWETESTPSEVEQAKLFLRASLGDNVSPPTEGAWEHFKSNLEPRFSWLGDEYPDYIRTDLKTTNRGEVKGEASDEFRMAVEALKRQHPIANTVYGYSQAPEMKEGTGGTYNPGFGHIAVSSRQGSGNETPKGMMNTLRHELSHHLGGQDTFDSDRDLFPSYSPWTGKHYNDFSAYDVGMASDKTMQDIYLPSEEADIREEQRRIENYRNNFRLRNPKPTPRDIELPNY